MANKLTLSIDQKTIERAKVYSAKSGKSISKLVEEYLNSITGSESDKGSVVKRLSGSFKESDSGNTNWKQIKTDYLKQKYGH